MESGYFHVNWNTIPGLYNRKSYLRTLVIEREEWGYLSDPTQLRHYWEPTDNPDDFHRTLGLAVCWTPFHDSSEPGRKKEYVVSVAVVRKLARHHGLPFLAAAGELREDTEETPTLLLVRLHRKSLLFPDVHYDRCGTHFTLMHDTGKGYNVGDQTEVPRSPSPKHRHLRERSIPEGKASTGVSRLATDLILDRFLHEEISGLDTRTLSARRWRAACSRGAFCLAVKRLHTI